MDRDTGFDILTRSGWLAETPVEFRRALLADCRWRALEPGASVTLGGDEAADLIGLAAGLLAITPALGLADTPMMHLARPVFWLGYGPLMTGQPRRVTATARSPVWVVSLPSASVQATLAQRPEWWRHFLALAVQYGDTGAMVAADLMIRGSTRRLGAVLLRMAGARFASPQDPGPFDVPLTQEELALAANMSRNTCGSALKTLARDGLVHISYASLTLPDAKRLRAFVDNG